jgi:hypothetical protein
LDAALPLTRPAEAGAQLDKARPRGLYPLKVFGKKGIIGVPEEKFAIPTYEKQVSFYGLVSRMG